LPSDLTLKLDFTHRAGHLFGQPKGKGSQFLESLNMAIFIYIARTIVLLRCCFSKSYRESTRMRWQQTPTHRVIYEVGTAIVGLVFLGAGVWVLIISTRK
jgi:hypothetical protein